ncbi:putative peptidoglycan lipid II flippase MurJ [Enhygromyxa salina]|uniref:Probable lipid II flippase MurJ n=1 Tax=Enhygromyxa salina TaxID=215803 RepID=A0A0C2D154_9BACT|nr:murein biosynthesis integral membrane protein MurJ [Enhygromyxa salina]KIG13877.1 putative peptidoglycan lipid II flippase MurJ [Enhygromyxa salina]
MPETLRTSGKLSIAVAASRVLGLVREVLFAHLFGVGAIADAYQVAFRIPNLLRDLFAEGALSSAFVPTFLAALVGKAEDGAPDHEAAYRLGNLVLAGVLLATGSLSVLGFVFAEQVVWLIADGFEGSKLSPAAAAEKLRLAALLTRLMIPLLTVISVSAVWMGMLNAQKHYMAPAWAPAMFNVVSILAGAALLVIDPADATGIVVWSAATLGAGVVQAAVQLPALWRLGYRPIPRLRGLTSHPGVRRIVRLMAPAVIGLAAMNINVFVNTRFAANLGDGPIAQLSYAFRVFYLPIGVFSVALATVTTTRVSEDVAKQDMRAFAASAGEGVSAVWMLMTASTVGLVVLAEPVVRVLYFSFSDAEATATAMVLSAYVLGLLPYGLVKVLAPVFYGLDRPRLPLLASFAAVAVTIGFNAATYETYGAPGLALGTTIGALVNITVLRLGFRRAVGALPGVDLRQLAALLVANAVLGGVVFVAWYGVEQVIGQAGFGWSLRVAGLAVVIPIGFFTYVAILRALAYPGAALLWALPSKLWRRIRGGQR